MSPTKVTPKQIAEIRILLADKYLNRMQIARRVGVRREVVDDIASGRRYKDKSLRAEVAEATAYERAKTKFTGADVARMAGVSTSTMSEWLKINQPRSPESFGKPWSFTREGADDIVRRYNQEDHYGRPASE